MRSASFVVAIALALSLAPRAEAQDVERARQLFAEGVQLIDEQQWAEAVERFRAVMPIRSTPQVKYNLALALRGTGQLGEAAALFREVSVSPSAPEALRNDASGMLRRVARHVGHLTIRIDGDDDRASVMLDGHAIGLERIGYAMPVDPGEHEIVLRRGDETLGSRSVHVRAGHAEEVTLAIAATRSSPARATLPAPQLENELSLPEEHNRTAGGESAPVVEQWWFWTAIGAVGVVLVSIVAAVATTN